MTFQFDGYNYLLRLDKGELLVESLKKFMQEKQVRGAWISAIGGASWTELGFYQLERQTYEWKKLEEPLEIIGLQGTLAWRDEQPSPHLHGVFSRPDFTTVGGHVKEVEVAGTCELFIHIWNKEQLTRTYDKTVGLNLLSM